MKKAIFMMMATGSLLFAACGNNPKNESGDAAAETVLDAPEAAAPEAEASIVGTWKLSDIDLGMEAPKGKEKRMEEMKAKMIAGTVYTFNDDGTMSFKTPMLDNEIAATYTYDGSTLSVTDNTTKKAETIAVESLTADQLVLSSEQGGRKTVMTFSK